MLKAVAFGHLQATVALVNAGADLYLANNCGETPVRLASLNQGSPIQVYLLSITE